MEWCRFVTYLSNNPRIICKLTYEALGVVYCCCQCFRDAISCAVMYKKNPTDFTDIIMKELEVVYHVYM